MPAIMRILVMSIWLLPSVATPPIVLCQESPPPAKELFARAARAMGAPETLDRIKAISSRGTIKIHQGNTPLEAEYTLVRCEKNRAKTVVGIQGTDFKAYSNEQYCWSESLGRVTRLEDGWITFSQLMHALILPREYEKHFDQVKTLGETKFDGSDCFEVDCQKDGKLVATFYFAKDSGHIAGFTLEQGDPEATVIFRDFKKVDDVTLPHELETQHLSDLQVVKFKSIVLNEKINESEFAVPESIK